jgi:hypothetical protein
MAQKKRGYSGPARYDMPGDAKVEITMKIKAQKGLTEGQIAAYKKKFGCAAKPILQTINELGYDVLRQTDSVLPEGEQAGTAAAQAAWADVTDLTDARRAKKATKAAPPAAKVAPTAAQLAATECTRLTALAEHNIARARAQMAKTAQFRRDTEAERLENESLRMEVARLRKEKVAMKATVSEVETPAGRFPYMPLPMLRGMMEPFVLELARRHGGGKQRRV